MIPHSIRSNLAALRRRERSLRLAWGLARWLAVVLALLLVGGLIDWFIDRDRDTPWGVRYAVFAVQLVSAAVLGFRFLVWPQLRRLGDAEMALWVEAQTPELRHRLISAVQLNRAGADTGGMSPELIGVVTQEAERHTGDMRFADVADHRRLRWSLGVVLPVAAVAILPLLLWPTLSLTLLARQFLADEDIPHNVQLANATAPVFPAGERVHVLYRVRAADLDESTTGELLVAPDGQPRDRFSLEFIERTDEGDALFGALLPASSIDFVHSARLGDGRSREPSKVRLVPRPVVTAQEAWVQLPAFCGLRPNGERYEQPQGRGDVVGIPGSSVRVAIQAQKALTEAELEILGPAQLDPKKTDDEQGPEVVKRTIALTVDRQNAGGTFELRPEETGYRIVVKDEHKFPNIPAPRRSLRMVPEEPPQVALLKDYFGIEADSDLEGIPVPLGKAIRIPYVCHGPYGLGHVRVLYRVLKKQESASEVVEEEKWISLPLPEVAGDEKSGPFDPRRGIFLNSSHDDPVPFHAVPSTDPERILGRTLGGGRYFLETEGLIDGKGNRLKVKVGDQIEHCVEVFADRDPNAPRPSARSETRITTIVTPGDLRAWTRSVLREEEQIRRLDSQQRGVFEK